MKEVKDGFLSIVSAVDSPFKLFVVVLLGILGSIGYFAYSNQALLFNIYEKNNSAPSLNADRIDDVVTLLMKDPNVRVVSIFSVDPIFNKRILLRAYARDGVRNKALENVHIGLFSSNPKNNADVVSLMSGETPCGLYSVPQSEAGVWYIEQGARYTCRVSIPPSIESFIGQITVAYADVPENLDQARAMLGIAAQMLTRGK